MASTLPTTTRTISLNAYPQGTPTASDFAFKDAPIASLEADKILVRLDMLSVDPYLRGRMTGIKSYADPFHVGDVISSGAVGTIIASTSANFSVGDRVAGLLPWAEYSVLPGSSRLQKIGQIPAANALSACGLTGVTAYLGLFEIGRLDDVITARGGADKTTVVVSGAAGATGQVVGQIAKLRGCHVVGIAGTADKIKVLTSELGFDAAVNYKSATFEADLKAVVPNGVDLYFDNVGGSVFDVVIRLTNTAAVIVCCGAISLYNETTQATGPRVETTVVARRLRIQGFIVGDMLPKWGAAIGQLGQWLQEGKIKDQVTVKDGFENTPEAFIGLFRGENLGKMLVRVSKQ